MDPTQQTHEKSILDYVSMFWRRRVIVAGIAATVLVLGTLVVYLLPPIYKSDSLVLIESQQVPDQYVRSTITTYADERIEVIRQRVLTTGNVLDLIRKFSLYPREQKTLGPSELADVFRQATSVSRVNAQGSGKRMTIAFSLAFQHREPKVAQAVNNELLTLFLGENVKTRSARAAETTEFLRAEADRIQGDITTLESKIAEFKQENREALPELAQANTQQLDRLNSSYREVVGQIEMVRGRVELLESQLVLSATQPGANAAGGSLWQLEQDLAQLLTQYTEKHPQVMGLRQRIEEMKRSPEKPESDSAPSDSPASLQLKSQLDAAKSQLKFLMESRKDIEAKLVDVQQRISLAPKIEQEYNNLMRDLDNTRNKYQELRNKELEAKIAQNLEEEQMGERFSVIEPPTLPELPAAPDRPKLMLLVLALAGAAGAGIVLLLEQLQPALWGANAIGAAMGGAPLVMVPVIALAADPVAARQRYILLGSAAAVVLVLLLCVVHFFMIDLQLLWYMMLDRVKNV